MTALGDKVHRPRIIACTRRALRTCTMGRADMAPRAAWAQLKPFQAVQSVYPLAVHHKALTAKQGMDAQVPVADSSLCNLADAPAQSVLWRAYTDVAAHRA